VTHRAINTVKAHPSWTVALLAIAAMAFYWFVWAHDRYVSRATIIVESPQLASPDVSVSSILSGGSSNNTDLLLLREYLLSIDMLKRVQNELPFRKHYSSNGDYFAKLHDRNAPIEDLHDYYLRRVTVELDEYAGVLNIRVQAFTAEFAQRVAKLLLEAGEAHMNDMGQRLAREQVQFLREQVERLRQRLDEARSRLIAYQNEQGLVSPTSTVESLNKVVAELEGQVSRLEARRKALASYQSGDSPEMRRVKSEIEALREEIAEQRDRLAAAKGKALNEVSAKYKGLELQAEFARKTYSDALSTLEKTRLEAARKLKQVSVLQSPLLPEYPTRPDAVYNITVFTIVVLFLAFIVNMLILIVREHRD